MKRYGLGMALAGAGSLLLATGRPAWATVDVVFGDDVTAQNCPADISLSISGGGGTVGGLKADLQWDASSFTLVDESAPCTLAEGVPGAVHTRVDPPDVFPPPGRKTLRILLLDFAGAVYPDGPLLTCKLRPTPGTAGGLYPLDALGVEVGDTSGNLLPSSATGGEISVVDPTFCCPQ